GGLFLVSFWKPLILLVPIVGWLWVISRVYDKHAARFFLPRTIWNVIHLSIGCVAFAAALAIPMQNEGAFWIGLGVLLGLLAADLFAYAFVANKDERVPEEHHVKFSQLFEGMAEARAAKAAAKRQGKVELVLKGPDRQAVPVPEKDTPEFELRLASEGLVLRALEIRASQVDVGPTGKDSTYAASYLVDGVRQPGETMPGANAIKIIDFSE